MNYQGVKLYMLFLDLARIFVMSLGNLLRFVRDGNRAVYFKVGLDFGGFDGGHLSFAIIDTSGGVIDRAFAVFAFD